MKRREKKTFLLRLLDDVYETGDILQAENVECKVVRTYRKNWYRRYNDPKLNVKSFYIESDVTDLYKRAELVGESLMEL